MFFIKNQKPYFLQIGFYFLLCLGLYSCQKSVEGCTSPNASNYNPEADKDCCCEFYQLQLSVRHCAADTSSFFSLGAPFGLDAGAVISPLSFSLLLNKVELINQQNQPFLVNDSVSLSLRDGSSLQLADDFSLLNPAGFVYNLGSFTRLDTFTRIRMELGLSALARQIDPNSVSGGSPLALDANPLLYDSLRQDYNSGLLRWAISGSTDTFSAVYTDNIRLDLPCYIISQDGANTRVKLDIFYSTIFSGIDPNRDPRDTVLAKISRNLPDAFIIR